MKSKKKKWVLSKVDPKDARDLWQLACNVFIRPKQKKDEEIDDFSLFPKQPKKKKEKDKNENK